MAKSKTKKVDLPPTWKQELVTVSLNDIEYHPDNARKGNKKKIKASIKRNGFLRPIVVQESTGYIVAGNHAVKVAKAMGIEEAPALIVDIPDDVADEFMAAENKTGDEATYYEDKLDALLGRISSRGGSLEGTGYTKAEAEAIHARAEWQDKNKVIDIKKGKGKGKKDKGKKETVETKKARTKKLSELAMQPLILSIPIRKHEEVAAALKNARDDIGVKTNEELLVLLLVDGGYLHEEFTLFTEAKVKKEKKKS